MTPLSADCVRQANQVTLRVSGRLVHAHPPSGWRTCLQRLDCADLRVDLAGVTEMDARGLGMLAELTQHARTVGGRVTVVSASPRVKRLLTLARLDGLLGDPKLAA
jgi:anti-anti-sigma factor